MEATIYARFSRDNQREESITAQVRACTDFAQRQGYNIVKVYTDEAKSATTDDRPGFMQMISDIKTHRLQVDVLLDISWIVSRETGTTAHSTNENSGGRESGLNPS
jgi:site-specific DNA recombinase